MHPSITKEYLHTILSYDPVTTKLVPKSPQPQIGITAAKFGQRHLLLGATKYSMAKLAYLYHHGVMPNMVTHIDNNKLNFAPDNLTPYKPSGRPNHLPIPDAVDAWQNQSVSAKLGARYQPIVRPPKGCIGKPILLTDAMGYSITARTIDGAKRLARLYAKSLTDKEKEQLGMITQTVSTTHKP